MHRTAVRHLQKAQPLGLGEGAAHLDLALDVVDLPLLGLALGAVEGVDLRVAEPHPDPLQGDALAIRVEPQRHRGAGAEGAEQQLVGIRAGLGAAHALRLVHEQGVVVGHDLLQEALGRSHHEHLPLPDDLRILHDFVVHGAAIVASRRYATGVDREPILEAVEVAKTYADGTAALAGVTLAVNPGETVALVGESGSGKTTLLRTFNRMIEPSAGAVRIEGKPAADLDPIALRRRIGYVPQDGGLIPHWRVERNVELVPRLLGWDRDRRRQRTREMLELVGLSAAQAGRYPAELSGGQRQRVAFARALAADPPLILLDEPFGALDALTRLELHRQFLELKSRLAKTAILVTHDLGEAFRLADRIGVMRGGRLLQLGLPKELEERPADPYVSALLELRRG